MPMNLRLWRRATTPVVTTCQLIHSAAEGELVRSSLRQHRTRPVNEQAPQVAIPALTDGEQFCFSSRGVLPWDEAALRLAGPPIKSVDRLHH